jgi:DNA processing protein
MVGSRRASTYGLTTTERFAFDLSSRGITVVSGMARGIDTAAHRGALKGGSATIGVLGCGIDVVYPAESRRLFSEMAEQGALLSEFPIATPPLAENFPRRNRIISGLSHGVLVVEAAEGSGSLITAQYALEQGRDVYAVPGNIGYVGSCGTNRLIKDGAKLVTSVEDIMDELPGMQRASAGVTVSQIPLAPGEEAVVTLLGQTPCHIDEIIAGSALTVGEVSAMLLRLELKGAVKQLPGKHYVRP